MTVIVTGASRGIGRAIAERLYLKNHDVLGIFKYTLEDDKYTTPIFEIEQADVTKIEDLNKIYEKIKHKKVSGLINAAGVFAAWPINYFKHEDYKKVIETNLIGSINTCSIFLNLMDKNKHTPIINISSTASFVTNDATIYTASKTGLNGFTSSLARELNKTKIRPNAICPGMIETDMTKLTALDKKAWESHVASQPIGMQLTVGHVADIVELLFDERSSCIGGQAIQIG